MAILITIMVLELKVPHGDNWDAMRFRILAADVSPELRLPRNLLDQPPPHVPPTDRINGSILWANLHLLFWLSLVPFATGWMGENHFASLPDSGLRRGADAGGRGVFDTRENDHQNQGAGFQVGGSGRKGRQSEGLGTDVRLLAIPIAFVHRGFAEAIYIVVAFLSASSRSSN